MIKAFKKRNKSLFTAIQAKNNSQAGMQKPIQQQIIPLTSLIQKPQALFQSYSEFKLNHAHDKGRIYQDSTNTVSNLANIMVLDDDETSDDEEYIYQYQGQAPQTNKNLAENIIVLDDDSDSNASIEETLAATVDRLAKNENKFNFAKHHCSLTKYVADRSDNDAYHSTKSMLLSTMHRREASHDYGSILCPSEEGDSINHEVYDDTKPTHRHQASHDYGSILCPSEEGDSINHEMHDDTKVTHRREASYDYGSVVVFNSEDEA